MERVLGVGGGEVEMVEKRGEDHQAAAGTLCSDSALNMCGNDRGR